MLSYLINKLQTLTPVAMQLVLGYVCEQILWLCFVLSFQHTDESDSAGPGPFGFLGEIHPQRPRPHTPKKPLISRTQ